MSEILNFSLGKKGALLYRRSDGSIGKTGVRIRDCQMYVYDLRSGEWLLVPGHIAARPRNIAVCIVEAVDET